MGEIPLPPEKPPTQPPPPAEPSSSTSAPPEVLRNKGIGIRLMLQLVEAEIVAELPLTSDGRLQTTELPTAVKAWLEEQVDERVARRVVELESLVQQRVSKAKADLEVQIRAHVEMELRQEVANSQKREVQQECVARLGRRMLWQRVVVT
jgi:hypothetical protein